MTKSIISTIVSLFLLVIGANSQINSSKKISLGDVYKSRALIRDSIPVAKRTVRSAGFSLSEFVPLKDEMIEGDYSASVASAMYACPFVDGQL